MQILSSHEQWPAVQVLYNTLTAKGFNAYLAGGAVRDAVMGRMPNDLDIATDATPEQVEALFEKVVMVGKQFGVCRVVIDDHVVEVATFRQDGFYEDGRRPKTVTYSSPKEDALRRDFTINGMFYDLGRKKVIDFVGGCKDLEKGVIRAIGEPAQRFEEDKLRILRGLRFLSQLELPLDTQTAKAMEAWAPQLTQVSQERVTQEWEKLLMGSGVLAALELSHQLKVWQVLFSDWPFLLESYQMIFGEDFYTYEQTWALWFLIHWRDDVEQLEKRMREWKLPKELVEKTVFTAREMATISSFEAMDPVGVALFLGTSKGLFATELYPLLHHNMDLRGWVDQLSKARVYFQDGQLPESLVKGDDLIRLGVRPGPQMAEVLTSMYRLQLKNNLKGKDEVLSGFPLPDT